MMTVGDDNGNNTVSRLGEALVRASMLGDEQQVTAVLQQCTSDVLADVVNYASGQSQSRMTALMWAAAEGHFEIARRLLHAAHTSSGDTGVVGGSDQKDKTVMDKENENSNENDTTTTTTVVDIDACNANGYTALLFAMENVPNLNPFPAPPPGFPGAPSLTSSSSSFSFGSTSNNEQPKQQPRRTITSGHVSVINLLLDHGADITIRNDTRDTILHMAVRRAQTGLIRRLLVKGLDINDCSNYARETPLHVAARQGHVEIARMLCELGAEVNGRNVFEWTPLMWAAASGWERVVVVLLGFDADVSVRGGTGKKEEESEVGVSSSNREYTTALIEARKSSKPESIAKLLVRAGALE